jgi:hypothetical protein
MRNLAIAMLLALPSVAAAQPGMTPYYAQPPVAAPEPEPKARLELSLGMVYPKGDWKTELPADRSPTFGVQLGVNVAYNVSLFGGYRHVSVRLDEQASDGGIPEDFELTHRELQLGLRLTSRVSPGVKLFAEGHVSSTKVSAEFEGESDSISGIGAGVRSGLVFMADRKIGIGVALSYTSAGLEIDDESGEEFDDTWVGVDANLNIFF